MRYVVETPSGETLARRIARMIRWQSKQGEILIAQGHAPQAIEDLVIRGIEGSARAIVGNSYARKVD